VTATQKSTRSSNGRGKPKALMATALAFLFVLLLVTPGTTGSSTNALLSRPSRTSNLPDGLMMGLYDKPLPPRLPPRSGKGGGNQKKDKSQDEWENDDPSPNLHQFVSSRLTWNREKK